MLKIDLAAVFANAIRLDHMYVAVQVQIPGNVHPELIINRREDFESKCSYYMKVYDDELNHNSAPGIKIVDAASTDKVYLLGHPRIFKEARR